MIAQCWIYLSPEIVLHLFHEGLPLSSFSNVIDSLKLNLNQLFPILIEIYDKTHP